jgi:hypothetical protein
MPEGIGPKKKGMRGRRSREENRPGPKIRSYRTPGIARSADRDEQQVSALPPRRREVCPDPPEALVAMRISPNKETTTS